MQIVTMLMELLRYFILDYNLYCWRTFNYLDSSTITLFDEYMAIFILGFRYLNSVSVACCSGQIVILDNMLTWKGQLLNFIKFHPGPTLSH